MCCIEDLLWFLNFMEDPPLCYPFCQHLTHSLAETATVKQFRKRCLWAYSKSPLQILPCGYVFSRFKHCKHHLTTILVHTKSGRNSCLCVNAHSANFTSSTIIWSSAPPSWNHIVFPHIGDSKVHNLETLDTYWRMYSTHIRDSGVHILATLEYTYWRL